MTEWPRDRVAPSGLDEALAQIGLTRGYRVLRPTELALNLEPFDADQPIFADVIREYRPHLVIEVGTWKGGSLFQMHAASVEYETTTRFICVDTWLGSDAEMWLNPDLRASLMLEGGYPTMFRQFIANVVLLGAESSALRTPDTALTHTGRSGHHSRDVISRSVQRGCTRDVPGAR